MKKIFSSKLLLVSFVTLVVLIVVFSLKFKTPINFSNLFALSLVQTSSTPITAEPEFTLPGTSTLINIGKFYVSDSTYSFSGDKPIYGLSVYGNVEFKSEDSLVRVVLVTDKGEKLVAEFYPLIFEDMQVNDFNVCEETCALDGEIPKELKIEVYKSNFRLDNLYVIDSTKKMAKKVKDKGVRMYNAEMKVKQDIDKIRVINAISTKKNKTWFAGETDVSAMTYAQKKKLYGQSKFPAGFEYYVGGVIKAGVDSTTSTTSATSVSSVTASTQMVSDWDWRNRHGVNWLTSVKNQGACGSCWAFASTGATEAQVNLYFNKKIDLDLSEQDVLSCSGAGSCSGGFPDAALDYIKNTGIVDENAFTYTATNNMCVNKSKTPTDLIKIAGRLNFGSTAYPKSEDTLKKMMIKNGPLSGGIYDWSHAMALVGWKTVKEGDRFFYRNLNKSTIWYSVPAGSTLIGKTVWIFKNSWGSTWGDSGYVYIETSMENIVWTHSLTSPVQSLKQPLSVSCVDSDNDGYYWWGLGNKPTSCPASPTQADGDDSNPTFGPIDSYGNLTPITSPVPTPTPEPEPTPIPTPAPVADFSADKLSINQSTSVSFSDLSTNSPTSWLWNFIGGTPSSSSEKNPTVLYNSSGAYDVSLTSTNDSGSSTKIKSNYISVLPQLTYGNMSISSNPTGASVYVDGVSKGVTPLSLTDIPTGSYNIKITKAGYQSYTTTASVTSGQTVTLNSSLIKNSKRK